MKQLIIYVSDNRVTYIFTKEKEMAILDIKQEKDKNLTTKLDKDIISASDYDICVEFAERMMKNHSILTPYEFNHLSGDNFNGYAICVIDNLTKYDEDNKVAPNIYTKLL